MLKRIQSSLKREEGQALVEYSLILALISVVAVAMLTGIGGAVQDTLSTVLTNLTPA